MRKEINNADINSVGEEFLSPKFTDRTIKLFRTAFERRIEKATLNHVKAVEIIDHMAREMAFHVECAIWGEEKAGAVISYPANWIEAVKERWLPEWALKKWPVKYTHKKVDFQVLYPDLNLPMDAHTKIIRSIINEIPTP